MKEQTACTEFSPHEDIIAGLQLKIPGNEVFFKSAAFFKALSDPTRTKIIWALDQHELCVCDLAGLLCMTPSAVSHQLSGLRKDNMVKSRKSGKEVFYSLADDPIRQMLELGMKHLKK